MRTIRLKNGTHHIYKPNRTNYVIINLSEVNILHF
jgi:hypothetical protein